MALSIKDPKADRLARELAELKDTTITQAVVIALEESVMKEQKRKKIDNERLTEDINEIVARIAKLPVYDTRSPEEILGYDENGLPS